MNQKGGRAFYQIREQVMNLHLATYPYELKVIEVLPR